MKFVLLAEGQTERGAIGPFLKRWLDPQLGRPVGIAPIRFQGWPHLYKDVVQRTRTALTAPDQSQIIAVIALLDLYGPTFYPNDLSPADKRYVWAKQKIEAEVGRDRFRMYFAVHEVEAWLLSEPKIFPSQLHRGIPTKPPESVNFHNPPAKMLDTLYESAFKRGYKKIVHGKALFDKLDPARAYERCPHLKLMLDDMLDLARRAGV